MPKKKLEKKEPFKDYIEARFKFLGQELFIIPFININFTYTNEKGNNKHGETVFKIHYNEPYHQSSIMIFPQATQMYMDGNIEGLDDAIIHELSHIHTTRLSDLAHDRHVTRDQLVDADEELTETLAQYIRIIRKLKNIK